jgi:hypothetical protein
MGTFSPHSAVYACAMGTGYLSLEVKRLGHEAEHLPYSSAEFKNCGAILPLPIHLHGIALI